MNLRNTQIFTNKFLSCFLFSSHTHLHLQSLSSLNLYISSLSVHGCLTHWFGCVIDGKISPIIPVSPTFPLQYQYQNFCLLNYCIYQAGDALISPGSFQHTYLSFCLYKILQCSSVFQLSRVSRMSLEN